jgi:hypothetical protein
MEILFNGKNEKLKFGTISIIDLIMPNVSREKIIKLQLGHSRLY